MLFHFAFKRLLFCLGALLFMQPLWGQSVLIQGNTLLGPYFYSFDMATCTYCPIMPLTPILYSCDFTVLPNGNIFAARVLQGQIFVYIYEPPSTTPVQTFTISTAATPDFQAWYDAIVAPDGTMYVSGQDGLYTFDYNAGVLTYVGPWPASFPFIMTELILINGQFYGQGGTINGQANASFYRLNMTNPAQSVLLHPNMPIAYQDAIVGVTNIANPAIYTATYDNGDVAVATYDTLANTTSFYCDVANSVSTFYAEIPAGTTYTCICITDAGTLPQAGPYSICANAALNFPAATGTVLDANDLRRYILFSNPADTAGSIVAISSTPSFTFNPATMQTGVTYYIAAMAGNGVNGNVDLNDPCLDFSNALQVIWRPLPSVVFSVANPDVCAGGCTTVTATFTGASPFTLTYTIPGNGPQSQTFAGSTGSFQACVPAGAPAGSFQIAATKVVDAWCTCE